MTSAQFRLINARALAKEIGGIKPFADKMDMSLSQASQIIGEHPTRSIGTRLARRIEQVFITKHGSLDRPPDELFEELAMAGPAGDRVVPAREAGQYALIPLYSAAAAAGAGRLNEAASVEARLAFRRDWFASKGISPSRALAVTAEGRSMEERIHHGDTLLVDQDQARVVDGKIYALEIDEELRVKRLFTRIGGGLRLKSDNPEFGQDDVAAEAMGKVRIIGRVVWIGGEV